LEEAILYYLQQRRVEILTTFFVSHRTGPPVNIHLAHRRGVVFENATHTLLPENRSDVAACLVENLHSKDMEVCELPDGYRLHMKQFARDDQLLKAYIPKAAIEDGKTFFTRDLAGNERIVPLRRPFALLFVGVVRRDIGFTSCFTKINRLKARE